MTTIAFDRDLTLSFSVKDRKASADWYGRLLGFELMYDAEEIGWCEMKTPVPGVSAGFADSDAVAHGGCTPVLGVMDIAQARASLEAQGVRFDGETQHIDGLVKLATFYDPDGHSWMLSENLMRG
jgi:CreA protein